MRLILNTYIKFYRVELSDVVKSVDEFRSLAEFFNRELKAGVRPIHATLVSPVDGNITEFGKIEGDKLLQVKGKYYNLYSLLKNNEVTANYLGGYFVTIYLSPADYHNIHSPIDGVIEDVQYIPGNLWPVNQWSINNIDSLFCINERIFSVISNEEYGKILLLMVGATNVGSIKLDYDEISSNSAERVLFNKTEIIRKKYDQAKAVSISQKIASFNLGSTVILLFPENKVNKLKSVKSGKIKIGEAIFQ